MKAQLGQRWVGGHNSIEDAEWTRLEAIISWANVTTEMHRCPPHLFICIL